MTKQKSIKKTLLTSVLSLVLCMAMLVGTTFAWFTDSVTSSGNVIKSGTLKVTMEWKDVVKKEGSQDSYKDASTGAIFNYDLWEPGYVDAKHIKISNIGTLALKYQLAIEATGTVSELADVIDVYFAEGEVELQNRSDVEGLDRQGTLGQVLAGMPSNASGALKETESDIVTIALKMQESAGNQYQNKSIGSEFAVKLLATQDTVEADSFDDQYDKNAFYGVTNENELLDALETGGNIMIANDIVIDDTVEVSEKTTIDLNGNTLDIKAINANADMTIYDSGEISGTPIRYQDPATIIVNNGATVTLHDIDVSTDDWGSYQEKDGVSGGEMFALYIVDGNVVMNNGDLIVKEPEQDATYGTAYGLIIENGTFTMNGGSIIAADGMANPFAIGATVTDATDECVINLNNVTIETKYMISLVGAGKCTVNLTETEWDDKWTYKRYFTGTYKLNNN